MFSCPGLTEVVTRQALKREGSTVHNVHLDLDPWQHYGVDVGGAKPDVGQVLQAVGSTRKVFLVA
eukprot:2223565-Rhodomonas_salina.2